MKLSKNKSCPTKVLKNEDYDNDDDDNSYDENSNEEESFNEDEKVKDKETDDKEKNMKAKRTKSVFFDPTTQVKHPFPDLIWKMTFYRLPEAPELNTATLTSQQVMNLLHCCLLSNAVYKNSNKRRLPPNLSNIVLECTVSDYYRIPYFVVDSHELDTIFVAFRGSSCMKDWHVDFLAAAIQFADGYVHEGVLFTALNIFNDIKHQLHLLSLTHNKRKIIMTGHSLGGAVAGMMAILFNEVMSELDVKAVCLAPVASLSKEIWDSSHNYIQCYINYCDLVPFISYYNTYYLPENSLPKIAHANLVHWCLKKINKHSKRPEFRQLVEAYTKPITIPYKLIPPGNSYIICIDKKESTVKMQSVDDQCNYFGQFLKNLSVMKHPIKLYKHSIIRFVCDFYNQDKKLIDYYNLSKKNSHRKKHNHRRRRNNNDDESDSDEEENVDFNFNASAPAFYSSSTTNISPNESLSSINTQSQTPLNESIITSSITSKT